MNSKYAILCNSPSDVSRSFTIKLKFNYKFFSKQNLDRTIQSDLLYFYSSHGISTSIKATDQPVIRLVTSSQGLALSSCSSPGVRWLAVHEASDDQLLDVHEVSDDQLSTERQMTSCPRSVRRPAVHKASDDQLKGDDCSRWWWCDKWAAQGEGAGF